MKFYKLKIFIIFIFSWINLFGISLIGEWDYGYPVSTAIKDSFIYVGSGSGFYIFKLKDTSLIRVNQFWIGRNVIDARITGDTLCIFTEDGANIYDITNPVDPNLLKKWQLPHICFNGLFGFTCSVEVYKGSIEKRIVQVLAYRPKLDSTYWKSPFYPYHTISTSGYKAWQSSAVKDSYLFISQSDTLLVFCLSQGFYFPLCSKLWTGKDIRDMIIKDTLLFGIGNAGFIVFNISRPESVSIVYSNDTLKGVNIELTDTLLIIGRYGTEPLRIINISDLQNPSLIDTISPGGSRGLSVDFPLLSYCAGGEVKVVNISDPSAPVIAGSYKNFPSREVGAVCLYESLVFAGTQNGLWVVDISDPSKPYEIGHVSEIRAPIYRIKTKDSVAFVASDAGIYAVNFSNPSEPFISDSLLKYGTRDLFIKDSFLYFTACNKLFTSNISSPQYLKVIDSVVLSDSLITLKYAAGRLYAMCQKDSVPLEIAVFEIDTSPPARYITTMSIPYGRLPEFSVWDSILVAGFSTFDFLFCSTCPFLYYAILYFYNISNPFSPESLTSRAVAFHPIEISTKDTLLWIGGYGICGVDSSYKGTIWVWNTSAPINYYFEPVLYDSCEVSLPNGYVPWQYSTYNIPQHVFSIADSFIAWKREFVFPYRRSAGFQIYKYELPDPVNIKEIAPVKIFAPEIKVSTLFKDALILTISVSQPTKLSFSLFDVSGRKIFQSPFYKFEKGLHRKIIMLPSSASGVYWLKIQNKGTYNFYKVISIKH